jgi:hypothetical protein
VFEYDREWVRKFVLVATNSVVITNRLHATSRAGPCVTISQENVVFLPIYLLLLAISLSTSPILPLPSS